MKKLIGIRNVNSWSLYTTWNHQFLPISNICFGACRLLWTHFFRFRAIFNPFAAYFRVTFPVSFQFDAGFCFNSSITWQYSISTRSGSRLMFTRGRCESKLPYLFTYKAHSVINFQQRFWLVSKLKISPKYPVIRRVVYMKWHWVRVLPYEYCATFRVTL